MTLQTMHVVIGVICLSLWSCAWGAKAMTFPVKEAAISADRTQPYWLDNTHVLFHGFTGVERGPGVQIGPGKEVRLLNHGFYVWDIERDTVSKDARFEHAAPECINGQTKSYILSYSLDGKTSQRQAFVNGEEVPLPDRVWVNPISCRALTTQPPWILDGHTSSSKVPLLEEHGYIDRGIDGQDRRKNFPLLYHRPGTEQPIPLGIGSQQVEPAIIYYSFADVYLLRGSRSTEGAPSSWVLHPNGTLDQLLSLEGKAWARREWTQFHLTKRGLIFVSPRAREVGDFGEAGLYMLEGQSPTRIVKTLVIWSAVSPDGCKLAMTVDRWDPNLPGHDRSRLQIIDVCMGGNDVH
jgi:hypothetical protein